MPRSDPTEAALAHLRTMASDAPSEAGIEELRVHLRKSKNHAAAEAARVAEVWKPHDLIPDLVKAFDRFMKNPEKKDQGCTAKLAIVECLQALQYADEELYLRGARHVQMEPVYGGREDTAPALRGACVRALAVCQYSGARLELVALLNDPVAPARREAARLLTWLADESSELLLRMRVLARDADPEVMGECLSGLMKMAPERSLEFVASYLDEEAAVADGAALALGESRLPEALACLTAAWDRNVEQDRRKSLLLPIALIREDEAFSFVLDVLRNGHGDFAEDAVRALSVHASDAVRSEAVLEAVDSREDRALAAVYRSEFTS